MTCIILPVVHLSNIFIFHGIVKQLPETLKMLKYVWLYSSTHWPTGHNLKRFSHNTLIDKLNNPQLQLHRKGNLLDFYMKKLFNAGFEFGDS